MNSIKIYIPLNPCLTEIQTFLNTISHKVRKVDDHFKSVCDDPFTLSEIISCIGNLKDNRAPGNDGLTTEFYKFFKDLLAPFIHLLFLEALDKQELPPFLKQGVITLIPKPNKDKLHIDNWRPITLLNNDCKIFSLILAKRLKRGLEDIIDEEQSGFMHGRNIHNNIRLILDMIDYNYLIPDESFILFIDYYKAFDTVEHSFLFKVIEFLGFGPNFLNAVTTLYNGCNSSIKLQHGTTQRFQLHRGLKQGCPCSPFLFLLSIQMLSSYVKLDHFKGISTLGTEFKICQLADDTSLFLKDKEEVSKAVQCVDQFSYVSGLKINLKKSVLFPLKECTLTQINEV